jgi:nitroreductase
MKYSLSEITDIIKDRRTIYPEFFSERKVHKEMVEKLLNNAIWAPTHGMTQPWRFTVFMNEGLQLLSNVLSGIYQAKYTGDAFNEMKYNKLKQRPLKASAVIAIVVEYDAKGKITELDDTLAVGCAVQNMMLTATAYGLGAFWATPGIIKEQEINEFLNIENGKCLGFLYLGYPAGEWPKSQRKPIEYITKWIEQ